LGFACAAGDAIVAQNSMAGRRVWAPRREGATVDQIKKDWKYYLGLTLFCYCFVPLLTVELVAFLPLSTEQAVVFGAIYVGSGELAFLLSLALLGKPFVTMLKEKLFGFFRRKPGAAKPVGRFRHRIGVVLFLGSFAPYFIAELALLFMDPENISLRGLLYLLLSGDVAFIVSLFVLGDPFWDKLKALFRWEGAV
jgi:hypothetical protein